jgi:hypothetical protein
MICVQTRHHADPKNRSTGNHALALSPTGTKLRSSDSSQYSSPWNSVGEDHLPTLYSGAHRRQVPEVRILSSCPTEGFDDRQVRRILDAPKSRNVITVLAAGRRADNGTYKQQYRFEIALFENTHPPFLIVLPDFPALQQHPANLYTSRLQDKPV